MLKDISSNLSWSASKVTYGERCNLLNQRGVVVWFTGISGAGKSTIAIEVERELINKGRLTYRLDGDNVRYGLCSDLGFSDNDRNENIRRLAEMASLFRHAGFITLVSLISPYRHMREFAKKTIGADSYVEVYIKADINTCIARDPKGLYKKALEGKINHFTGISSEYEEPENPDIFIDTAQTDIKAAAMKIIHAISPYIKITDI
jgi:adenylylsulfate kinase